MLLQGKNAVIYGAGGSIGSAVARAFAREGATVFLGGRTVAKLDTVTREIAAAGGAAQTAQVDAINEQSLRKHVDEVVKKAGSIDISFNAISWEDVQGTPLIDMPLDDFSRPINVATRTQFLTAKAVAPHMIKQRSGVIMTITAQPARLAFPLCGGFSVACAAVEGFSRCLAAELGPHGVRVLCLRSAGSPESIPETLDMHAAAGQATRDEFITALKEASLLKRLPSLDDVGNVAALMASDYADTMTATVANMTCGQVAD